VTILIDLSEEPMEHHTTRSFERWPALILAALLVAAPASSSVDVGYDEKVDFASYRTYAWEKGLPAIRPEVEEHIVRAVERELQARGLTKVDAAEADLRVRSYAGAAGSVTMGGAYAYWEEWKWGVRGEAVKMRARGTLLVELRDAATDRPVWGGLADENVRLDQATGDPRNAKKKIDGVIQKMFRDFPPGSSR
jgi:hypothetical protein